ncbi:MAG TPA: DUF3467 domain-containing protein [Candidatus Brocadiia bacterium]|nr:DUF3467 domain-containing protein [Candidatus Brocadiia bacterium]
MADENAPQAGEAQQGQPGQRTIRLSDEGVKTLYANLFSVVGDQDDIMLMFGSQFGNANVIKIESKIVVNARNAKRIALSLAEVIRRYEARNGIIDITAPPPRPAGAQAQPQGESN